MNRIPQIQGSDEIQRLHQAIERVRELEGRKAGFLGMPSTEVYRSDFVATVGELALVNTSASNVVVYAPALDSKDVGRCFAVARISSDGNLISVTPRGSVTINGTSSANVVTGAYEVAAYYLFRPYQWLRLSL